MATEPTKITESVVEQATLDWLGEAGYEVLSGLAVAPGEPAAERSDYKQFFLFDRLQTKLADLNPNILQDRFERALSDALLRKLLSGELRLPAAAQLVEATA